MRGPRGEGTGALAELEGRACCGGKQLGQKQEDGRNVDAGASEREGTGEGRGGRGRGGEGREGRAAPTQLNLLRDSPRPCVRKRKRK